MEIKVADTVGQTFDPDACRLGVHFFEFIDQCLWLPLLKCLHQAQTDGLALLGVKLNPQDVVAGDR